MTTITPMVQRILSKPCSVEEILGTNMTMNTIQMGRDMTIGMATITIIPKVLIIMTKRWI
tara:strand:- start:256 stop:435 length:180 start_codon:yes stop_codon:yes gene_type:complete